MCMWRKLTWTLINTPHPTRPSSRRVFSKACTTTGAVFPHAGMFMFNFVVFQVYKYSLPIYSSFCRMFTGGYWPFRNYWPITSPILPEKQKALEYQFGASNSLTPSLWGHRGDPKVAINHWQLRDNLNPPKNRQFPVPTKMCCRDRSFKFHSNQGNMGHISKWPPRSGKIIFQTLLNHYVRRRCGAIAWNESPFLQVPII